MFFKIHYIFPIRDSSWTESETIVKYVYKWPTLASIMYRTATDRKLGQCYKPNILI